MLKTKHLLHPFKATAAARQLLSLHMQAIKFARLGESLYSDDPRYDLQVVHEGFTSCIDQQDEDTDLLQRICTAYAKSIQISSPNEYKPISWWESFQHSSLKPVMRALEAGDLSTLRTRYRNFFRDSCSDGLVEKNLLLTKSPFYKSMMRTHESYFLSDALYRLDCWSAMTDGQFSLRDLEGPRTGNPFGITLNGTLVRTGSEYQHYCAHRTGRLLFGNNPVVVEIGGGYGGMAYYLLRDFPQLTYIDFDLPETIALASYYLLKAFPEKTFLLYGEEVLNEETLGCFDVILLPIAEFSAVPSGFANLIFSSHAISDLSSAALIEYMNKITDVTRDYFLYEGLYKSGPDIPGLVMDLYPSLHLVEEKRFQWYSQKSPTDLQHELLYQIKV